MPDDVAERRARWEKAGKPLFSRFYTYEEIQARERDPVRPIRGKKRLPHADMETPKEWPDDTKIDPGTWVSWLPEGWKQGIRTQELSGKVLKCYMSDTHRRFWHKPAIEKFLGKKLPNRRPVKDEEEEEGEQEVKISFVTDPDLWPTWPDDWLPKDWRLCFRQLPSGTHKIYVPPNQEAGFCYQRKGAEDYINSKGKSKNLTPFGTSQFMEEKYPASKKRKSIDHAPARRYKFAKNEDYEEVKAFGVFKCPLSDKQKKACGEAFAEHQEIQAALVERQFKGPSLLLTSLAKSKKSKEPVPQTQIVENMCCFWYKRPDDFCGKPCFQRVFMKKLEPTGKKVLICSESHIFWSKEYNCWKIGVLNEDMAGYLKCEDPAGLPWETKRTWKVVKSQLCLP